MAELAVVLDREVVGRLSLRPDGGMTFEYSPAYKGPPVSASMPVGPVTYDDWSCRAVFGGLLPEGRQREFLAGQLHVSAGNDFALLDALGGDVAGALALLPDEMELPATQQKRVVSSQELAELVESVRVRPLAVQRGKKLRMSLAPFYDLLGTALHEDLTTQMAMRVGDAWELSEVTRDSFLEQAMQPGFSRSFAAERIDRLTDAVEPAAERLSREERHQNEAVRSIRIGIRDRVRSG